MTRHISTTVGSALLGISLLLSLVFISSSVNELETKYGFNPQDQLAAAITAGNPILVQSRAIDSGSVQNSNISFYTPNIAGNTIVVALRKAPPQTCNISDSIGNTYALIATADEVGDHRNHLWYAKNIKAGSNTLTISCPQVGTTRVAIQEFSNFDTNAPLGQFSTNTGNSGTPNIGNLSVTQSKEMLFGFCSVDNTSSFSVSSGYNMAQTVSGKIGTEYRTVTSPGTYNPTFYINPADVWTCIGATFKTKSEPSLETSSQSSLITTDTVPPVISTVQTSDITSTSATISWNTNEPSTSQIEYGFTSAYGSNTAEVSSLTTSHSIKLSGLLPSTIFNYRVKSKDATGNISISNNFTFRTPATAISQPSNTPSITQPATDPIQTTQQYIPAVQQQYIPLEQKTNQLFTAASVGGQPLVLTDFLGMDSGLVGSVVDYTTAIASSLGTSGTWVNGPYYNSSTQHELKVATIPPRPAHGLIQIGSGAQILDTGTNRGYVKKLTNATDAEYVDYVFNNPKPSKVSVGMYFYFSSNGVDKWNTGANPRYYDLFALTATDGMFITLNGQTRGSGATPLVLTMETFPCGSGVEMMRPQLDKWYWITTQWDGSTRTAKMAVYDPSTWQIVGTTQSCGLNTSGALHRISVGQYDNHGYPSLDSEYYMDDLMIDANNATFPLIPGTGSSLPEETEDTISCDLNTVQAAVNNASAGSTITCNPGSWTWGGTLSINKGVILKGAPNKGTIINSNTSEYLIDYDSSNYNANTPFRVSGFVFDFTGSAGGGIDLGRSRNDPPFTLQTNVRIDHNTFRNQRNWGGNGVIRDLNVMRGVVDNNLFDQDTYIVRVANPVSAGAWWNYAADPAFHTLQFGQQNASMYYEDNTINKVNDTGGTQHPVAGCQYSGRYIFRYNNITVTSDQYPLFDLHGNATAGGSDYSCFGTEMYGNRIINNNRDIRLIDQRGGRAVIFGNEVQTPSANINIRSEQSDSVNPVTTINPLTGRPYTQHVTESYYWNNKSGSSAVSVSEGSGNYNDQITPNVDYFSDTNSSGVRIGTRAQRPTTCTPGSGYWETNDSNSGSLSGKVGVGANPQTGSLYRCATNGTWSATPFYTPLAYPHPLRTNCTLYPSLCDAGSAVIDTTPPTTPSNFVAVAVSSSAVNLSWSASTDAGSGVVGYRIFRCSGGLCTPSTQIATGVTNTTYNDTTGLTGNTTYRYTVAAYDGAAIANASQPSTIAQVTTPPVVTSGELIAPDRRIDWSGAGANIVNRTAICANLTPTNTLAQINTAIANCTEGEVVQFGPGTYNLGGGIIVNGKNNITLRGAGPEQTLFVFSGYDTCGGLGGSICLKSRNTNYVDSPGNVASWTAGYSKGTNVITLSNTNNLQVGSILMLDQINDSTTDNNEIWINRTQGVTCQDCASPSRGSGANLRTQIQTTTVVGVNGNQVTINPPIIWPNFDSSRQPEAWWAGSASNSGQALTGVGIENISVDTEGAGRDASIFVYNTKDSWIKNVRIVHCRNKCVRLYQSVRITVRDSYMFDKAGSDASQEGSESYGIDAYLTSMFKYENNIAHHITTPWICESGVGGVVAYNYSFDDFYNLSNPDWAQASYYVHGNCAYILNEGNKGFGMIQDIVHAPNYFMTAFRNRWEGWESGKTLQTVPIHIYAPNRFSNIVGNVLGTDTYHTKYESYPGNGSNCNKSIFALGFGGNCGSSGGIQDKANVRAFLLRWGNYDTVNDTSRFDQTEVPSSIAKYPNYVPASNTLPASLYLSGKPSWFGSVAFPPIGPDVSGGNEAGVNGRAYKIPAQVCFERGEMPDCLSGGTPVATGEVLIKLVGSNLLTTSAPLGVQSRVDSGSLTATNPNTISALSTGSHTVSFTDATGFNESYATCTFSRGGTECSVTADSSYVTTSMTCASGLCTVPITVTANTITKVVPKYVTTVVPNASPILNPIGSKTVNENENLTFIISATDLDADTLEYSVTAGMPPVASFTPETRVFSWTPGYTQSGNYSITFSVSDGRGGIDTEIVAIRVNNTNRPPTTNAGDDITSTLPATVSLLGSGWDWDTIDLTYSWTKVSGPGNVVFSAQSSESTTASFSLPGQYTLQFTISDGEDSTSDTLIVTVNPAIIVTQNLTIQKSGNGQGTVTSLPVGINCGTTCPSALFAFEMNTSVTLSAASKQDSIFNGWTGACTGLTTTCVVNTNSAKTVTANFIIASTKLNTGDRISVNVNNLAVRSTPNGTQVGAHNTGSLGTVIGGPEYSNRLFWWNINYDTGNDGWSAEDYLDLYVIPENRPPVLNPIGSKSVDEKQVLEFRISGSDPDGDRLTYSTVGTLPTGVSFVSGTATFSWTPDYDQAGDHKVVFNVSDGRGENSSETVNIKVNDVIVTQNLTVQKSGNGQGTIASSPAGINCGITCPSAVSAFGINTSVTLSAASAQNSTFTGWTGACVSSSVTCVVDLDSAKTATANFIVTSTKFDSSDRVIVSSTGQPSAIVRVTPSSSSAVVNGSPEPVGSLGTVAIGPNFTNPTYSNEVWWRYVNYDSGISGWTTENSLEDYVAPVNNLPVFRTITTKSINEGESISFSILADDLDRDTLTYSVLSTSIPSGYSFVPATRTFSWTPSFNQSGSYQITFNVSDGKDGSDTETVTINVININQPPSADAGNSKTVTLLDTVTLTGTGTDDVDNQDLTYTWSQSQGPSTANISSTDSLVTTVSFNNRIGTYIFRLTVSDGTLSASDTVTIRVVSPEVGAIDTDQDTVPDSRDTCPNTPGDVNKKVNSLGCPVPRVKQSITITDLTNVDLRQVESFDLSGINGKISFKKGNFLYSLITDEGNEQLDLDTTIDISPSRVYIDSNRIPQLRDKSATITLYGITLTDPIILRDGAACVSCEIKSHEDNTLIFTVSGFSEYTVIENTPPPPVITTEPSSDAGQQQNQSSTIFGSTRRDITNLLDPSVVINSSTVSVNQSTSPINFTRTLYRGLSGNDVRNLQVFLNTNGYPVSAIGAGSRGLETIYFGQATESALKRFQCAQSIVCSGTIVNGYGVLGPRTRGAVNARLQGLQISPSNIVTTQPVLPVITNTQTIPDFATSGFTRDLTVGSRGEDVRQLQIYLNTQGFVVAERGSGSLGNESSYFGSRTQAALARFQSAKNINPPKGYFGRVTRAFIRAGE